MYCVIIRSFHVLTKYHSNISGNFNPTNSRNIHDDTDTSLDRSGHSYVIFLITIPGIIIGVIVLFIAIACVRKQPIMNTSSAADLLKDPSNPKDGFLNNDSFTQHNGGTDNFDRRIRMGRIF